MILKPSHPQPCRECPFRRTSLKGWLGPWPDALAIHREVMNECDFACHMTLGDEDVGVVHSGPRRCAGAMMYAKRNGKVFRDPVQRKDCERLKEHHDIMGIEEFLEHHNRER